MSGQKLVVFHRQRGQRGHLRVRSGVLHAMRPRAVPDSKGVQWFDVHRGRDMRAALPPFDGLCFAVAVAVAGDSDRFV